MKETINQETINQKKTLNNNHITIVKAIGIILMVIGHSRGFIKIDNLIYLFHVPLFFFCSGYFFKENQTLYEFTKRKIIKLYIPYIKWSFWILLLHNVFYELHFYNEEFGISNYSKYYFNITDFKNYIIPFFIYMNVDETRILGGFWFIKVLFWSSIIFAFIRKAIKNKYLIISIAVISSIIFRKYSITLPVIQNLSIVSLGMVFYACGYFYKGINTTIFHKYRNILLGFTFIFIISFIWDKPSMFCEYYLIPIYTIVALIGIITTVGFSYHLNKISPKLLYYIGNNTLSILALHFIAFKLVSLIKIYYFQCDYKYLAEFPVALENKNDWWWILYTITGIFIPIIIKYYYDKIKFISIYKYVYKNNQK